ncbi:carboxypeptidase-like regulatory domain-containing protein [uncultured Eudoraea sp.]|uniref:carboxypeptidase-like regulatory domain-containing protein n=1 Tax=uncultured Eudoraea sp. TaxID=1035614 RepID=UPI002626FFE3|nr:carboxypeptidase-like regulatory domain-containing protein [uncultured Eudoraea sp.]
MPRNKKFFLIFFLIVINASAQSIFSKLKGKVTNGNKGVPDVHVMNTSANRATITDSEGLFSISAKLNDTILFSAVQYKRMSLVVSRAMLESRYIIVPLEEFINELDEVVVRPYNLSGDLSRDMNSLNREKVYVASTLGLPNAYVKPITQAERKLNEATTGGGLVPLNPIINAISGRTKYLKKVVATQNKYARTNRVREYYADSMFVKYLKIPESKIEDFMYFCEVDIPFSVVVDSHDKLKIWEYLKLRSNAYLKEADEE